MPIIVSIFLLFTCFATQGRAEDPTLGTHALANDPAGDRHNGTTLSTPATAKQMPGAANMPAAAYVKPFYTCNMNYYVSKSGNDSNDGKTPNSAWLTIGRAVAVLAAKGGTYGGVCVDVGDGTYTESIYARGLCGSADAANGYLVFHSHNLHGATVQLPLASARGGARACFRFDSARFIVIDGFNLVGQIVPNADENGVVTNSYPANSPGHHIKVLNNIIHDHGGAGVGAVHTDYLVVEGNVIYKTCNTSPYEVSGISTWQAVASDHAPGFHNIIRNNIVFDNAEVSTGHATHSDGNGIIIDDFRNTQNHSAYGPYTPQTLVENNLVFGNGGAGIHIFLSDNITVRNNTTMGNMCDPKGLGTWRGEINVVNGRNVTFVSNIAVAVQTPNQWHAPNVALMDNSTDSSNIGNVWKNNLSFNGTSGQASTMISRSPSKITAANNNILGSDPLFTDPSSHDYTLRAGSPAIGKGTNAHGAPADDLAGQKRTSALDLGAYAFRRGNVLLRSPRD